MAIWEHLHVPSTRCALRDLAADTDSAVGVVLTTLTLAGLNRIY